MLKKHIIAAKSGCLPLEKMQAARINASYSSGH